MPNTRASIRTLRGVDSKRATDGGRATACMYSALYAIARPSVRLSRVDQSEFLDETYPAKIRLMGLYCKVKIASSLVQPFLTSQIHPCDRQTDGQKHNTLSHAKHVEARMSFHRRIAASLWFLRQKLHREILTGFLSERASNKGGLENKLFSSFTSRHIRRYASISLKLSVIRPKLVLTSNMTLHMHFRLAPSSKTFDLDDIFLRFIDEYVVSWSEVEATRTQMSTTFLSRHLSREYGGR